MPATIRTGSTLMIVIVLMGLLAVLGVLFYTFAAQERSNAENYSDGAKNIEDPGLSADDLMDFALQQLVVNTDPRYKTSALWGSRHSMAANMLGVKGHAINELTAFDGQGIHIGVNGSGQPIVDQDYNGVADSGNLLDTYGNVVRTSNSGSSKQDLLGMNDSPAANNLYERDTGSFPQPDVGYTYPDINNAFLAYQGWVRDRNSGTVRRFVIPSFHRPQLYRDASGNPVRLFTDLNYNFTADPAAGDYPNWGTLQYGSDPGATFEGFSGAQFSSQVANRSFRPHPGHVAVPGGQQPPTIPNRFIYKPADAASLLGDGKRVFPFMPMYPGYNPSYSGGVITYSGKPAEWIGHQGVWSGPHPLDASYSTPTQASAVPGMTGYTMHDLPQFDCDNDGDGIRDGIWIDLGFPAQELPDGTLAVPIFSITAYDLDALFNLNVHGNISQLLFRYPDMPFGNGTNPFGTQTSAPAEINFISASNLGVHAGEVNPGWGLTGRPGIEVSSGNIPNVFAQHVLFYGNKPQDASMMAGLNPIKRVSFEEPSNMELANLKMGRPKLQGASIQDLYPGLYGEEHLIAKYLGGKDPRSFPHAGASVVDDNNDQNENMLTAPYNDGLPTPTWLTVEQPYDALGIGSYFPLIAANGKVLNRQNPGFGLSRVRWLRYTDYANNGNVFWANTNIQGGGLMKSFNPNSASYANGGQAFGLFDDPSEVALYATDNRDVDDPLAGVDAAFLAMSNTDLNNLGLSSRLSDLAPFNFTSTSANNARGEDIRKKFTTVANDRKNFSAPRAFNGASGTTTGRMWEWTDDNGYNSQTSFTNSNGMKLRFPPTFGAAGNPVKRYATVPTGAYGYDPFRPALRYLLQATRDDLSAKQFQQRLSVNQLLVYDLQSKQLSYRDLTPHPLDPGNAVIPTAQSQGVGPTTVRPNQLPTVQLQEFWARRDRQQMARDIYVLLYLFGRGLDGDDTTPNNPLRTAGTTLYTDQQLEQMARFAVNLVDAMDRDNAITRFEYDKNLSNGWDLDDDPYNLTEPGPNGPTDRAEVWGVERQELAFSEVLAFRTTASMTNTTSTAHDDTNARQFMDIELRNLAPYDVHFTDRENWQIVMKQFEGGDAAYVYATHAPLERRLTLKNSAGVVSTGGFYTIFSTDRTNPATNPSAFQADPMAAGSPIWIAPRDSATFGGPANANGSFIDLVKEATGGGAPFRITDGKSNPNDVTSTAGAMLSDTTGGPGTFVLNNTNDVRFALRRRAHPTRSRPTNTTEEADNPWVEVDRMVQSGPMPNFNLGNSSPTPAIMQAQLAKIFSQERAEPLSALVGANNKSDTNYRYNTFDSGLNAENTISTNNPFQYWQQHFDRQFSSIGDLLLVPLVGPPPYDPDITNPDPNPWDSVTTAPFPLRDDGYTTYTVQMGTTPSNQYGLPVRPSGGNYYFLDYPKNLVGMLTLPDHPTATSFTTTPGSADQYDNRWYRVLEFLEVPTRQNRNLGLGTNFNIPRQPGKINLNTLRNPEVLAGLIDDEKVCDMSLTDATGGSTVFPTLYDFTENEDIGNLNGYLDAGEDLNGNGWLDKSHFEQLQFSRDATDPYWNSSGHPLALPGLANSRPFQGLMFADAPMSQTLGAQTISPIDHTLLRTLAVDQATLGAAVSKRRLFEVGNATQHQNASIDPLIRHRILSKLWGNTTTRSNSFAVFISAKMFRAAVDPATGLTRVGGPVREYNTQYRGSPDNSPELPEYRGVFIVDRSKLEDATNASGGAGVTSFQPFVVFRQIVQQ